jgi:hypothetical protein
MRFALEFVVVLYFVVVDGWPSKVERVVELCGGDEICDFWAGTSSIQGRNRLDELHRLEVALKA